MTREFKFEGETFLLDDSNGCYVEANYKDQVGYVGVNLQGTANVPYLWWTDGSGPVTSEGLNYGNSSGADEVSNIRAVCTALLRKQREAEARKAFKPEEACRSLHAYVEALPR